MKERSEIFHVGTWRYPLPSSQQGPGPVGVNPTYPMPPFVSASHTSTRYLPGTRLLIHYSNRPLLTRAWLYNCKFKFYKEIKINFHGQKQKWNLKKKNKIEEQKITEKGRGRVFISGWLKQVRRYSTRTYLHALICRTWLLVLSSFDCFLTFCHFVSIVNLNLNVTVASW